jgi:hypothetical protein
MNFKQFEEKLMSAQKLTIFKLSELNRLWTSSSKLAGARIYFDQVNQFFAVPAPGAPATLVRVLCEGFTLKSQNDLREAASAYVDTGIDSLEYARRGLIKKPPKYQDTYRYLNLACQSFETAKNLAQSGKLPLVRKKRARSTGERRAKRTLPVLALAPASHILSNLRLPDGRALSPALVDRLIEIRQLSVAAVETLQEKAGWCPEFEALKGLLCPSSGLPDIIVTCMMHACSGIFPDIDPASVVDRLAAAVKHLSDACGISDFDRSSYLNHLAAASQAFDTVASQFLPARDRK